MNLKKCNLCSKQHLSTQVFYSLEERSELKGVILADIGQQYMAFVKRYFSSSYEQPDRWNHRIRKFCRGENTFHKCFPQFQEAMKRIREAQSEEISRRLSERGVFFKRYELV